VPRFRAGAAPEAVADALRGAGAAIVERAIPGERSRRGRACH
jgi:hypothetical protein